MSKIVLVGGGGHAKMIAAIIKKDTRYELIGYTDVSDQGDVLGIKYLGDDSYLQELYDSKSVQYAAIGIGSMGISGKREAIYRKLKSIGYQLPQIIANSAIVNENVEIGEGSVVIDGAIINPSTRIGKCVIVNTNSSIGHDCRVDDFVHIASGVTVSGGVKIGLNTHIGTGASIIQYLEITDCCTIGAGAVVVNNCLEPGRYLGIPAKRI